MIFLNSELFDRKEKDWIGHVIQKYMNNKLDDMHQITRLNLYCNPKLRDKWRKEIKNVFTKVRADMENDPEFEAERQVIEDQYNEELYELIERWKAKNLRRSVLEYTKGQ